MRKLAILFVAFAAIVVSGLTSKVMADEPATTSELPAALQALGANDSLILSQSQADEVRGSAFRGTISLVIITNDSLSAFTFSGRADSIIVIATPLAIAFQIF